MKTRLLVGVTVLAAAVLAGGWLLADDKKPDDPKVHGVLPKDFKKLGLSDKQTQDIYKIEANYRDKIAALQQQLDDLKAAERKEVEGVLTDDQKAALAKLLVGDLPDKDKPAPPKDK